MHYRDAHLLIHSLNEELAQPRLKPTTLGLHIDDGAVENIHSPCRQVGDCGGCHYCYPVIVADISSGW